MALSSGVGALSSGLAAVNAGTSVGQALGVYGAKTAVTFAAAAGGGVAGHEIALGLGASETVADITGLLSGTAVGMAAGFGANAVDKHFNLSGFYKPSVVEFRGKTITQNDNLFDPDYVDPDTGKTNRQLMSDNRAPYGYDGRKVVIHHVDQTDSGPLIELSATEHSTNNSALHTNTGQSPSQINRNAFKTWRNAYWEWRGTNPSVGYTGSQIGGFPGIVPGAFVGTGVDISTETHLPIFSGVSLFSPEEDSVIETAPEE